ncbi:MAG: hypothetical protein FWD58_08485 [Firmicutes bacterium]|nr:hypothetical protein [Bacillota bacterium]
MKVLKRCIIIALTGCLFGVVFFGCVTPDSGILDTEKLRSTDGNGIGIDYDLLETVCNIDDVKIRLSYGCYDDEFSPHNLRDGFNVELAINVQMKVDIADVFGEILFINESWDVCRYKTIEDFTKKNYEIKKDNENKIVFPKTEEVTIPKELFKSRLGFIVLCITRSIVLEGENEAATLPWQSYKYLFYKLEGIKPLSCPNRLTVIRRIASV